jgi:glycosyltransferase involved in cell wall biosynthesis
MQACNPPDIFWPLARLLRRRDGTRFVFDHHDLCPELYRSRFHDQRTLAYVGLELLERMTFRTADRVTSTNESYAAVARRRGGKEAEHVTVVRTGPDPQRLFPGPEAPEVRRGREHLVAYIGVMGPQDGVDLAIRAAGEIVHELGRRDISFMFMGAGDSYPELLALRDELGLRDYVELPGRVPDSFVTQVLSTAELGLCPDPMNPLNDVSTMNKTMEYMAFGLPVVAFDLKETKVSAGESAVYVEPNDVGLFAKVVVGLLDHPELRAPMGAIGRERVVDELAWEHQQRAYLGVFDELVHSTAGSKG